MRTALPNLLLLLMVAVLPNFAHAQQSCEGLFADTPTRLHAAQYRKFVHEDFPFTDRLRNPAAIKIQLARLAQTLPQGMYEVMINGFKKDILLVSYDKFMNATIQLANLPAIKTESTPLTRSGGIGSLTRNMTFGVDTAIRLTLAGIELRTSTVRGNEKTLGGLSRSDVRVELNTATGPIQTMTIIEQYSNWSIYRANETSRTTNTRIEIVKRI